MKDLDLSPEAPWRQRFRATDILSALVAGQHPERGLICTNKDGIYQLYAWDIPSNNLTQVTHQPAGVMLGMISADGKYIYYLKDEGGNEVGHYVKVPFEGGNHEDISPNMPPYSSYVIFQSWAGNVLGFSAAGEDGFNIYIKSNDREPKPIYHSEEVIRSPVLSSDGKFLAFRSSERTKSMDTSLLVLNVETAEKVNELWDENASIGNPIFSPIRGDARLVCVTTESGFERPLIWDISTGERIPLQVDEVPGSIFPHAWSNDSKQILLCQIYQAQYQLYRYDVGMHTVTKLEHPVGTVGVFTGAYFAGQNEIWVTWQDAANPSCLVALDSKTGAQTRIILGAGSVPQGKPFRPITLVSENGDTIQGWLAVPDGAGPFPTILDTHGGPTWVMSSLFDPGAQCWVDHGYAYFTLNYHGSTTFGKEFEKSIWGNLGDLEVQDMAAACKWLTENNIARPDAILLTGISYGGYLTLQAIGRRPELWAGGMAVIAIADWKLSYEDESDAMRGTQRAFFGGAPDDVPDAIRKSSPITYAEQVRAPLLVIQGENDTSCPARQMKVYEEKLRSLGKQIEVHWFNAGHGSLDQEQQIQHQEKMLNFAYRILG